MFFSFELLCLIALLKVHRAQGCQGWRFAFATCVALDCLSTVLRLKGQASTTFHLTCLASFLINFRFLF